MRVLIVDDEPQPRGMLAMLLHQVDDMDVWQASDAAEAVELATSVQPDVVLLDVAMPGTTGVAALPQIRRAAPRARVAFHTAHSATVVHLSVHPSGPDATIEKGMPTPQLENVLRQLQQLPWPEV